MQNFKTTYKLAKWGLELIGRVTVVIMSAGIRQPDTIMSARRLCVCANWHVHVLSS